VTLNQAAVHQADIAGMVGRAQGFTLDNSGGGTGLKRLQGLNGSAVFDP